MKNIKKVFTLLLSISLFFLTCAGCQSNTKSEELIVGESVAFVSYDPIGDFGGQGFYHYSGLVYETLVNFEKGNAIPGLAKSWDIQEESITFYLRDDVKFTDGEVFNAEAVKLNLEKTHELIFEMISYYPGVSTISEIQVIDDYTIRLIYNNPCYSAIQDLSAKTFGMLSPNMFANGNNPYGTTTDGTSGTGPYILKEENIKEGQSYTFVYNEDYYGEISGPKKFTVKIIPDADARMLAIESGEIDLLYGTYQINFDMFTQLKKIDGIEARLSERTYSTRNILLNTSKKVTGDLLVRQAMLYGTDKQQIIDAILHGMDKKADTLFPPTVPFCNIEGYKTYEYDMERAIGLLEEAGCVNMNDEGIRVKDDEPLSIEAIYMAERPTDEQILMAFKGQMKKIGIDVKVSGHETMMWYEKCMNNEFDLTINDTYGFPQDPYVFMAAMLDYGADFPAQQGLLEKQEIDNRIRESLSTTDEAVISDAYSYVLTTLQDNAVNNPISYTREIAIYNSEKVKNMAFSDHYGYCDISNVILKDNYR